MLSKYKSDLNPYLTKAFKPLFSVHPNIITVLGVIPSVLFMYFLIKGMYVLALLSMILTVFDAVDGVVARATGKVSKFGGLLDSTLDRVADSLFITGFGFAGLVSWDLVIILFVLSYLISYIRSRAELAGKGSFVLNIGIIERSERVALLGLAVFTLIFEVRIHILRFNLLDSIFFLMIILSIVTVFQRMYSAYNKLEVK